MQHEGAPRSVFAPGSAQTPAEPRVEDDVAAIRELLDRIRSLWSDLTAHSHAELRERMQGLSVAAENRDTGSRSVRESLQQVLLTMGTGALATLSEPTRQRLAALTGIALPGHREPSATPDDPPAQSRPGST